MPEYRNCKQCGKSYLVTSDDYHGMGFHSYFCWEAYQREHKLSPNSGNSLLEDAITAVGAGLSLLVGSGESKSDQKAARKIKEEQESRAFREDILRRAEERKNDPEWQAKEKEEKEKREKMNSWSLEEWYKAIDDLFDKYAEEIKGNIEKAHYVKNDTKIISKLEKHRDKQKEIIRLNIDILKNGYNSKAKIKLFNALTHFKYRCIDLNYKSKFLSREKNPIGTAKVNVSYFLEENKKIINAVICIPATVIFFLLIFIFKNIGLVWGSVITVAIMAEAFAITSESDNIGNKIAQILFIPILGGIGGLVVGGVAWILSSFWTFTMILWSIVMLGASAILIFLDDMSKL